MKEPNEKVMKRFTEFIETYPEGMRYKVNTSNAIALMQWAYEQGYKDAKKDEWY